MDLVQLILWERENLVIDKISQQGEGDISIESDQNLMIGGSFVSLGEANFIAKTTGQGNLTVTGEMSSSTGDIVLDSENNINLENGTSIETRSNESHIILNAQDSIEGEDIFLDTQRAHLISEQGSIGADGQVLRIRTSGRYETLESEGGIYLEDSLNGLSIDSEDDASGEMEIALTALGDLEMGSIIVGDSELSLESSGNSFRASHLEGSSINMEMTRETSRARIDTLRIDDSFSSEANRLIIEDIDARSHESTSLVENYLVPIFSIFPFWELVAPWLRMLGYAVIQLRELTFQILGFRIVA